MQTEDYEYLYQLEEKFWWFAGMREITAVLLDPFLRDAQPRTILDAGCGTGGNLVWLRRYANGGRIAGLDYVHTALRFCQEKSWDRLHSVPSLLNEAAGQTNVCPTMALIQASATDLPFAAETFALVTSFDVLVQLPGAGADEQAMREMYRVLKPGGFAFVRCAAYEWMKSGHDAALDTQRRYTLPELSAKLERAGFTVLRQTYANTLLFPVAALRRLVLKRLGLADSGSDVKPLPPSLDWLNWLLEQTLLMEARWLRRANLPFGLSTICLVRK
jgi:ubiquinone/menaquinone biosynthesis C-methylase UbiE